ncbi:MAG: hypothetical protein M3440_02360 [Chloroflexota bacterium]|nr:hypothetical protein [Chloroflexota bacterium]
MSEISSSRDHAAPAAASAHDIMAALRQLHARREGDSPRATMLRVLWLRSDHADARISTELTHLRDDLVVFHADVTLANGSAASGYAAEPLATDDDAAATIERCETRAIGRALDILGYLISTGEAAASQETPARGIQETTVPEPTESTPAVTAEPRNAPPMVVNALRNVSLRRRGAETPPGAGVDPDTGEIVGPVEAPAEPATSPPSSERDADTPEGESDDDLALEDYSWTHFWKWARTHELSTKVQVEKRLGHSIDGRTPADVRIELQKLGIPL